MLRASSSRDTHTHYGFALQTQLAPLRGEGEGMGTPYAILRIEKLRTLGSLAAAGDHNHRLKLTPNADPQRGFVVLEGTSDVRQDVEARLPGKLRKNAVLAVQMLLSASPTWFGDHPTRERVEAWSDQCLAWLEARYGKNCVNVVRHDDESGAPHIHAVIVPMKGDGRLSCDHFFGTPEKLSKLQDDYAGAMSSLGLERGIKKHLTKREHQSVRRFYEMCNQVDERIDPAKAAAVLHQLIAPSSPTSPGAGLPGLPSSRSGGQASLRRGHGHPS